jgi:Na+/H+-dicarboxylate symporter
MKKILSWLVKVGLLPILFASLAVGVINLLDARRNHDYGHVSSVVVIWFILVPVIAFWTHRKRSTKPLA